MRAGRVVRAVEDDERLARDDFESARQPQTCERLGHHLVEERRAEERFSRGQRQRGVVTLMRAVHR